MKEQGYPTAFDHVEKVEDVISEIESVGRQPVPEGYNSWSEYGAHINFNHSYARLCIDLLTRASLYLATMCSTMTMARTVEGMDWWRDAKSNRPKRVFRLQEMIDNIPE